MIDAPASADARCCASRRSAAGLIPIVTARVSSVCPESASNVPDSKTRTSCPIPRHRARAVATRSRFDPLKRSATTHDRVSPRCGSSSVTVQVDPAGEIKRLPASSPGDSTSGTSARSRIRRCPLRMRTVTSGSPRWSNRS